MSAGEVERLCIVFDANGRPYARGLRDIERETNQSARTVSDRWDQAGRKIVTGLKWASVAAAAAIAGIGVASVKAAASFEYEMSRIQANADGTAEELQQLEAVILQLGKDTMFSAGETAEAANELIKAGLSIGDTMAALPGMLDLAAAGELGVAQAATITSDALNVFKLDAEDAGRVADTLALAANKSTTEVTALGEAFSAGASAAVVAGMDIEEFNAVLAILAQYGVKGAEAGTMLKTMFMQVMAPSTTATALMDEWGIAVYDANGQMLPMVDILRNLEEALGDATDEQRNFVLGTIFGTRGITVVNSLLAEGSEKYAEWTDALSDAGAAQDIAATKMDNLSGSWEELKGSVETALITMGQDSLGPIRAILDELTTETNNFVDAWNRMTGTDAWQQGGFEVRLDMAAETIVDTIVHLVERAGEAIKDVDWESVGRTLGKAAIDFMDAAVPAFFDGLLPALVDLALGLASELVTRTFSGDITLNIATSGGRGAVQTAMSIADFFPGIETYIRQGPFETHFADAIRERAQQDGTSLAEAYFTELTQNVYQYEEDWLYKKVDTSEAALRIAEALGLTLTEEQLREAAEEGFDSAAVERILREQAEAVERQRTYLEHLIEGGKTGYPDTSRPGWAFEGVLTSLEESGKAAQVADELQRALEEETAAMERQQPVLDALAAAYESIVAPADAWNQTLLESRTAAEEDGVAWDDSMASLEDYLAKLDEQLAAWDEYGANLQGIADIIGPELVAQFDEATAYAILGSAAELGPEFIAELAANMDTPEGIAKVIEALIKTYEAGIAGAEGNLPTIKINPE
ncbi:MAG: phage tail tape measure protein, partial [Thermoleophilia bacterium]|nr:phage tail tape measure protein [Thermoleophilia bacterium]